MKKNQPDPQRDEKLALLEDKKSVDMRAFRLLMQRNIHAARTAVAKLQMELNDIERMMKDL